MVGIVAVYRTVPEVDVGLALSVGLAMADSE